MASDQDKTIKLLEETHKFPTEYGFKFIVPASLLDDLLLILEVKASDVDVKPSKNGNYLSVTFNKLVNTPHEIIDVYSKVKVLKGAICL